MPSHFTSIIFIEKRITNLERKEKNDVGKKKAERFIHTSCLMISFNMSKGSITSFITIITITTISIRVDVQNGKFSVVCLFNFSFLY